MCFLLRFIALFSITITLLVYSQEPSLLVDFPPEIQAQIVAAVGQSRNMQEVIKTLSALAQTNTTFNQLVKSPAIKKWILNNLSEKQDLNRALVTGNNNIVHFLLDVLGFTPNFGTQGQKNQALFLAVKNRLPRVVTMLLNQGADPNTQGPLFDNNNIFIGPITALSMAARNGDKDIINLLLEKGANLLTTTPIREGGQVRVINPFTAAQYAGHTELAQQLRKAQISKARKI